MNSQINPLLQNSQNFDGALQLNEFKTEHYQPALEIALKEARENIQKIKSQKEITFENTVVALELASELADKISTLYFVLFSAEADEEFQKLAEVISPILSDYASDISLDAELFKRIQFLYDQRQNLNLQGEDLKLLEKSYKSFVRNGALLNDLQKDALRKVDQELSVLGPKFSENVLKATNAFELIITNREDLNGLPDSYIESIALAATQKGYQNSWLVTLQGPSLIPFLTYCENAALREKVWRANSSRCFKDEFDNQDIILKIVKLKTERAQILGFADYADYVLEERMAQSKQNVFKFLNDLIEPSKKAAARDLQEIQNFKNDYTKSNEPLKPWDLNFYSEKLKEKLYSFNEEELRPYFKLENVIEGVFLHAQKLFNLKFDLIEGLPVYHPDVKTYKVTDSTTGDYIGLFYTDFFPRETKKGGAWMTAFREQGLTTEGIKRPHVTIVCNFTKPTPTKPSLLTFDEVSTLFHEFGHALHGLLSDCKYKTLSGTNVFWDFVELPSQIMENWIQHKESLDLFARHYETGEKMPEELIKKIQKANKFQAGWMSLRQLSFGLLDMSWYTTPLDKIKDVDSFETQIQDSLRLMAKEPNQNMSVSFSHIFAGGYSAGYYSYKWAEVLDADAFEYFKEQGLFNAEIGQKFKNNILSRGGAEHPMELYKKFRGREPDPKNLLKRSGLI